MPLIQIVFKKEVETKLESIVQWFAGPMIHVDIVNQQLSYTSYMSEMFSVNPADGYSELTHASINLQVTQEENDAAQCMLTKFVTSQIPYNYNDAFRCILPGPTTFDGQDVDPDDVKTLYCSQAITLVLRSCLTENKALIETLQGMNARFTTPNMLYDALSPHHEKL